jgi:hypothetical protein
MLFKDLNDKLNDEGKTVKLGAREIASKSVTHSQSM